MKVWFLRPLFDILPDYPIDPLFTDGPAVWPYLAAGAVLVAVIATVAILLIKRLNRKKK